MIRLGLAATGLLIAALPALAATCPDGSRPRKGVDGRPQCPPVRKLEPYDPDRARAGSRPGFIDLGNGTEVKIGGQSRFEYGTRR